jgi:hypothetical protein
MKDLDIDDDNVNDINVGTNVNIHNISMHVVFDNIGYERVNDDSL